MKIKIEDYFGNDVLSLNYKQCLVNASDNTINKCIGCTSTNRKLETHPTNNLNALEKFWDVLGSGTFDKSKGMFKKTY